MAPTHRPEPPSPVPLRILVVEDSPINREVIHELLAEAGFSVTDAADGPSALAAIRETPFDLVLMDLRMPGMDGYETVRRLRRQCGRHLPVIAMTAHLMTADRLECLNVGMDGFIPKPLTLKRLRAALAQCAPDLVPPRVKDGPDGAEATAGPAVIPQLLHDFARRHAGAGEAIRSALDGGDPEEAARLAHGLIGTAHHLGAPEVGEAARRVETAILENRSAETIESAVAALIDGLARWVETIRLIPVPRPEPPDRHPRVPTLWKPRRSLPVVLDQLHQLVLDHNLRSDELLTDLRSAADAAGLTIPLDDLAASLARFDFPDARRELEKIARAARISLSEEP